MDNFLWLKTHMNPQQNEFRVIKEYALALPLSNLLSVCSSGSADKENLWLVLQLNLMRLETKSSTVILYYEIVITSTHGTVKDRITFFFNTKLVVVFFWRWFIFLFYCSVCCWGVFPKHNVTGKQMCKRSGSSVFVVPYCSIRLHPCLKHLSGSCSTVSSIMGAGKRQQC